VITSEEGREIRASAEKKEEWRRCSRTYFPIRRSADYGKYSGITKGMDVIGLRESSIGSQNSGPSSN
jgi:hypothetical protein